MEVRMAALTAPVVDTSIIVAPTVGLPSREDFAKVARVLNPLRDANPRHEFAIAACSPDGKRGYLTAAVRWANEETAETESPRIHGATMPDGRPCNILFIAHAHPKNDPGNVSATDLHCAFWTAKHSLIIQTDEQVYGLNCALPDVGRKGPEVFGALLNDSSPERFWIPLGRCKVDLSEEGAFPGCLE